MLLGAKITGKSPSLWAIGVSACPIKEVFVLPYLQPKLTLFSYHIRKKLFLSPKKPQKNIYFWLS
jgi:hypothetical protein